MGTKNKINKHTMDTNKRKKLLWEKSQNLNKRNPDIFPFYRMIWKENIFSFFIFLTFLTIIYVQCTKVLKLGRKQIKKSLLLL
jgi:hypothetical protein